MLNYDNYAITLGRAVELFRRRPEAIPEQKVVLRALVGLSRLDAATLRLTDAGVLSVEDRPVSRALPGIETLVAQMEGHDVREIRIAKDATPAEILNLLRALAVPLGAFGEGEDVETRLRASGARGVVVQVTHAGLEQVLERRTAGDPSEVPTVPFALSDAVSGAPELPPAEASAAALALSPRAPDTPDRLTAVATEVRDAMDRGRWSTAIRAVADLVQLEATAPQGPSRDLYTKAVTGLLTPLLLKRAADATTVEGARDAAVRVLRRGGGAGTEVLRDRLLAAVDPAERDHFFGFLRRQPDGLRTLTLLLQHPDEATARRAADLLGVLDVREAVPALGRMLRHANASVRQAVVLALAHIATPGAVEYLRLLLAGDDPEARLSVARAVSGRALGVLVPQLATAGRRDGTPSGGAEFARALGRVGTPDAVMTLVRWTERPGWRFWRHRPGLRQAAIEGLRLAGGPAAIGVMERLVDDPEPEIRAAARAALQGRRSIAARPPGA
jgi:hypothetical protein